MSEPVVELEAPDISDWVGNTGVPYVTTLDSGVPGPDAMINAVIHGNVRSSACFRFVRRSSSVPAPAPAAPAPAPVPAPTLASDA